MTYNVIYSYMRQSVIGIGAQSKLHGKSKRPVHMVSTHHLMVRHVTTSLFTLLIQCNRTWLVCSRSLRFSDRDVFSLVHGAVNHGQSPPYRLLAGIHCKPIDLLDHLSINQSMLYFDMCVF